MSIFTTDETAWSAFTKALEDAAQPNGANLIVQAPTVFRPLSISAPVDPRLAMFRRFLIGDKIPNYGNKNKNSYNATGASVGDAYTQYIQALDVALTARYASTMDIPAILQMRDQYNSSLAAQRSFTRAAAIDWKQKKLADPSLSRIEWDNDYGTIGYTPELSELQDDVNLRFGYWKAKASPYPELTRVIKIYFDLTNNPVNKISLPTTPDDLLSPPESWSQFLKTNFDVGDFFTHDAPQDLAIRADSTTSTSYESRWSAGGSVSYGFFSVGGSAGGGNIEKHLREGTQRFSMAFDRLVPIPILRGQWYDEGLLRLPYVTDVDKSEYWGPSGQLPLVPIGLLLGRGLTVSVGTSSTAYDEFQSWYHSGASGGFSFGPWSVGVGGDSSTSSSSISNNSTGTTLSFRDDSNTPYVVAVISLKMDEWLTNKDLIRADAESELRTLVDRANLLEKELPALVS